MNDELKCPGCGSHPPTFEKVSRPIWAQPGLAMYFCNCCSKTFTLRVAQS